MIQWFPGHMAKALREIREKATLFDLFIIVLDARAPISSYNEEFDLIAPNKPRLFVITKTDLGDSFKIEKIKSRFDNEKDKVVALSLKNNRSAKIIIDLAEKLLEHKRKSDVLKGLAKPRLRAMVLGVPNSGKSTLINLVSKTSKAKVKNMPGVTRGQQWISAGDIQLLDTPGILWPKFEDELVGIKLAIIGSIKTEILSKKDICFEGYKLLKSYYPKKLEDLNLPLTDEEDEIHNAFFKLARERNFISKNNREDVSKAQDFFINYLKKLTGVTYD